MTATSPTKSVPEITHQKHPSFLRWWKSPRLTAFAALAIALIAVAVAIAAWLLPGASHSFSDQESAQAKTNLCSAYTSVNKAVFEKTPNPHPGDPVGQLSVAANVRLALLGGGAYLRETVAAEPAAPGDLAKAVNSMGNTLEQMAIGYLSRANATVLDPLQRDLGSQTRDINKLCAPSGGK